MNKLPIDVCWTNGLRTFTYSFKLNSFPWSLIMTSGKIKINIGTHNEITGDIIL